MGLSVANMNNQTYTGISKPEESATNKLLTTNIVTMMSLQDEMNLSMATTTTTTTIKPSVTQLSLPRVTQPGGEDTIRCLCQDNQPCQLSHTCEKPTKYFPIFRTFPTRTSSKRLEIEHNQPQRKESMSKIKSLKKMCQEKINKLKQSTTVRSLYDITSEIVRDLLCGNVDTHATKMKLREDCDECGPGIHDEDRDSYIIGSDVVALFPSIKSLTTGRIIRKRVEGSSLRFPGFNYKQGARYIVMNKHLTGNLAPLRNILPRRRKTQGRTPGMTGKAVNDRQEDDDGEWQWIYPARDPTDLQKRMIIARCCEVGVRMVFENFTYKFGGVVYKQSEGGPIGARLTMSAARIVMMDWAEEYNNILSNGDDEPELLEVYVDDGRQAGHKI